MGMDASDRRDDLRLRVVPDLPCAVRPLAPRLLSKRRGLLNTNVSTDRLLRLSGNAKSHERAGNWLDRVLAGCLGAHGPPATVTRR